MGLTGHILEVELQLAAHSLAVDPRRDAAGRWTSTSSWWRSSEAAADWPFTMGWIDCLSRGHSWDAVSCLRDAGRRPRKRRPILPEASPRGWPCRSCVPSWVMGRAVGRVFNEVYYRAHRRHPRRAGDLTPRRSSIRSMSSTTGIACTAAEGSRSTSACCLRRPGPRRFASCWSC